MVNQRLDGRCHADRYAMNSELRSGVMATVLLAERVSRAENPGSGAPVSVSGLGGLSPPQACTLRPVIKQGSVVSVAVSVTHGKVRHFDFSSPAKDDTNSLFDCKLPAFHARLDLSLNQ